MNEEFFITPRPRFWKFRDFQPGKLTGKIFCSAENLYIPPELRPCGSEWISAPGFQLYRGTPDTEPEIPEGEEAWSLRISAKGFRLCANTAKGLLRGEAALLRILRNTPAGTVPDLSAADAPGLRLRGIMVSLHQVHDFMPYPAPDAAAMLKLLDYCFETSINAILIEYEAMFPWQGELSIIRNKAAYTEQDIAAFRRAAAERGIELIPLVQTLGHVYHLLIHPEFAGCAEIPAERQQLCPSNPKTLELAEKLVDQTIDRHPDSRYIHLGGDECRFLGACPRCKEIAAQDPSGTGRLYAGYYKKLACYVIEKGKIPVIWHDIAIHHPELLPEFPGKLIFHFWNYGDHSHGALESRFDALAAKIPPSRIWGGSAARAESPHGSAAPSFALAQENIVRMNRKMQQAGSPGTITTDWPDAGTAFLLSMPLYDFQGCSAWHPDLDLRNFKRSYAQTFFGINFPELPDLVNSVYGFLPVAHNFQSQRTKMLDRYSIAPLDLEKRINEMWNGVKNQFFGVEYIYRLAHRVWLCRAAKEEFALHSPQRRSEVYKALFFYLDQTEWALRLTRVILDCCSMEEHYGLDARTGTPETVQSELQRLPDWQEELRKRLKALYTPLTNAAHLQNYMEMVFPEVFAEYCRMKLRTFPDNSGSRV